MSQNLMPLSLYVNKGRVFGEHRGRNTENRHLENSLKLSYNGSISERIQIPMSYAVQYRQKQSTPLFQYYYVSLVVKYTPVNAQIELYIVFCDRLCLLFVQSYFFKHAIHTAFTDNVHKSCTFCKQVQNGSQMK